jgi:HlyD family secretion protein
MKPAFKSLLSTLRRRWLLSLVILALLASLGGFLWMKFQPEPVPAYALERQDIVATLTVTGEVEARQQMDVTAPFNARIDDIPVREGDGVVAGQVLVVLEQDELQARLLEAQGRLGQTQAALQTLQQGTRPEEIARLRGLVQETRATITQNEAALTAAEASLVDDQRNAQRLQRLYQEGAVSQRELETAETRLQNTRAEVSRLQASIQGSQSRLRQTQAQLNQAIAGPLSSELSELRAARDAAAGAAQQVQAQLTNRIIRAVSHGVVTRRDLDPGDVVVAGNRILQVANRDTLELVADVQEADISRIRINALSYVVLDALPEQTIQGRVTQIGSEVNPENGTVDVRVQFNIQTGSETPLQVMPGMTADVNIVTERLQKALVVPAIAVEQTNGKHAVFLFKDGRVVRHPIRVRRISTEFFEVVEGLEPGDIVTREVRPRYLEGKRKRPEVEPSPPTEQTPDGP